MRCPKCHFENPDGTRFCGNCAAPLSSPDEITVPSTKTIEAPIEELTTGSTFAGRYQIIEELGKGGMGKVYKAMDTEINEKVALKLIKPDIASDQRTIERFRNELKLARKIRHNNVCQMYDLNKEEGSYYITMEYVSGEDLKSLIKRVRQLTVGTAISIVKQICEGLSEAHKLGVVHRDLKPSNIMIDKEGNARIMDFGIARLLKTKGITGTGVMIGTPEYMSPEQVEGKEADQRSDIYSLGIILYEMVTSKVPFEGDTPFSIALKHKSETPQDPKELNPQIPDDLSYIILKCLEKDKENRYQSAEEVRSELKRIEEGVPTAEKVIPKRKTVTAKEITVTFGLKKLFIPALITISLVIIGVVIWQILPHQKAIPLAPSGKPSLAVIYFKNNTGDMNLDHWRSALAEWLITDLGQSKYIKVLDGDRLYGILRKLNLLEAKSYALEDLKAVAREARVNYVLKGSLSRAGDIFRIDFALQNMSTGESVGSDFVKGKGEESFHTMVDDLTTRIKAHLKLSSDQIASDIDEEVGKITTISPQAYKYYVEGRKYHHQVNYQKSLQLMEKAIAIDPNFAMAYRSMWASTSKKEYLQKAFELSGQLSAKERYWIEGDYYRQSEKTYDKAIQAFRNLLELYPESRPGNACLGIIYNDLEEWDKTIKQSEASIQYGEETYYVYNYQASAYMAKGLYDKAKDVLEYYLNNFSYHRSVQHRLILNYLCQGKYDLAHVEVDKGLSHSTWKNFIREKGVIYHCQGDLNEAEKEYQKLFELDDLDAYDSGRKRLAALYLLQGRFTQSKDQINKAIELANKASKEGWELFDHRYLSYIHLTLGKPEETLKECEKAWNLAVKMENLYSQRRALHFRGLGYIEMDKLAKAQEVADELKEMIRGGMKKKDMRLYYHLMGNIELKNDNYSKAIEYFKEAIALLPFQNDQFNAHALFFDPLALAYYHAGDLERAKEQYEKIISLSVGRLFWGNIYAKAFYMLGKIYEQKGWKGKAIENYEKFLDLWKDADPGIAEVEDARNRLAGLKSK